MLLSLLLSTASANEATVPALPEPPQVVSVWRAPPQLHASASLLHRDTQRLSALSSGAVLGAAVMSAWTMARVSDPQFKRGIAGANVVVFAVPGALLGAMTLAPAVQLANQGVRWAPSLGVASMAAGVGSVFVAVQARSGVIPDEGVFLAAGLAWAAPLLALSELLLSSRAGWRAHGAQVRFDVLPSPQGGHAAMTWSF